MKENVIFRLFLKTKFSEKWVSACRLKKGDKVLLSDGSYGIIKTVEVVCLSALDTTYNLEVEDFHTYYVSDNNILVHNMCANKGFESKSFNVDGDVGPYKNVRVDVEYAGANRYTMHLQYKSGPGGTAKLPFNTSINKFIGDGAEVFNASNKVKHAVIRASKYIKRIGGKLHW